MTQIFTDVCVVWVFEIRATKVELVVRNFEIKKVQRLGYTYLKFCFC